MARRQRAELEANEGEAYGERVLGDREQAANERALHEEHGVVFHLRDTASAIEGGNVRLKGEACLRPT